MSRPLCGFLALISSLFVLTLAAFAAAVGAHPSAAALAAPAGAPVAAPTAAAAVHAALRPEAPQGVWTDIATFPAAVVSPTPGTNPLRIKRAGAAAYPPNGNIYLLGGRHGVDGEDVALRWIWQYAPGSNTWTQKTALLDGAQQGSIYSSNMATAVLTNANGVRIYAVGGVSIDSVPTPVTRVYDPVADVLATDDPWPASPARAPGGWAVYNNVLYIFGGFSDLANGGAGGVFTDTWKFDPAQPSGSRWSQLPTAQLNLGRAYIAGAALDGYIYAIGGDTWTPGHPGTLVPVSNVERMDPRVANPTWTVVASLPTARGDMGAWAYDTGTGTEISGKVAVAGGHYAVPDAQGYLYDPVANAWGAFPNLSHATRNYGFAQLGGILYALGGYNYANGFPDGANFNQAYDARIQGTPTPTTTGTPPTATRTGTATGTATPTGTPCGLLGAIQNGGFETGALAPWVVQDTNPPPVVSTAQARTGTYSALVGTVSGGEPNGNGSIYQGFTVPAGATLSFWYYPGSTDSISFDWQDVYLTDSNGAILATILHVCEDDQTWKHVTFNLAPYAGQSVRVKFLVHQDGFGDDTYMYVDDVQVLGACATGTPAPPSATATATATAPPATSTAPPATATAPLATATGLAPTSTATRTAPAATSTAPAATASATAPAATRTPGATATPCNITFSDVHPTDYFYTPVQYLACHGVISGYADGTFRPYNNTTRSQMVKIVVLGFAITPYAPPSAGYTFADVPPANPFFSYIETAAHNNIVSGYACGGLGEPCDAQNRPYFRPYANVTRGQLSKIVVVAAGWTQINPATQSFQDVFPNTAFYTFVETAYCHGIISGYSCGGPGEPCGTSGKPYFRQFNDATRGQIAKIVYGALTSAQTCATAP
jgi:hypothetical protein